MKYQIFKINSYSTSLSVQILAVKLPIHADKRTVLIVSFLSIQVLGKYVTLENNYKSNMQHNSSREDNLKYLNNCNGFLLRGIKKYYNQTHDTLHLSSRLEPNPDDLSSIMFSSFKNCTRTL